MSPVNSDCCGCDKFRFNMQTLGAPAVANSASHGSSCLFFKASLESLKHRVFHHSIPAKNSFFELVGRAMPLFRHCVSSVSPLCFRICSFLDSAEMLRPHSLDEASEALRQLSLVTLSHSQEASTSPMPQWQVRNINTKCCCNNEPELLLEPLAQVQAK